MASRSFRCYALVCKERNRGRKMVRTLRHGLKDLRASGSDRWEGSFRCLPGSSDVTPLIPLTDFGTRLSRQGCDKHFEDWTTAIFRLQRGRTMSCLWILTEFAQSMHRAGYASSSREGPIMPATVRNRTLAAGVDNDPDSEGRKQ